MLDSRRRSSVRHEVFQLADRIYSWPCAFDLLRRTDDGKRCSPDDTNNETNTSTLSIHIAHDPDHRVLFDVEWAGVKGYGTGTGTGIGELL